MDQALVSSRSSTTSKLICFEHQWTIDDFPQVDAFYSVGECLTSSQFNPLEDNEIKFSIKLYPKGEDNETNQQWLSVFFKCDLLSLGPAEIDGRIFTCKVAVVNGSGELVNKFVGKSKFQQDSCFGFAQFMGRRNLFIAKPLTLLPKQKFTLHCEISYLLNESVQISYDEHQQNNTQRQILPNLSSQLGKYSDCEVSFKTSDEEIVDGHRCILRSASKIFEQMFDKESTFSHVKYYYELSDVSSEVFKEVLNFIYTGKVHRLDKHNAIELLNAAEKFQLDHFRSYCADRIRASLPPEEANQILARMPLAIMPDVCLLSIFDYVSIQTLFELRKVCTRWMVLFSAACARRTNLSLFAHGLNYRIFHYDIDFAPFDIPCQEDLLTEGGIPLMTHSMNASLVGLYKSKRDSIDTFCTNVSTTFENITHFKIVNLHVNSLSSLLRQYSSKLISLKLRLSLDSISNGEIESLFECIRSMSLLTHLTIHIISYVLEILNSNTRIQPPLPPSLKELNYYCLFPFNYTTFVDSVRLNMPKLEQIAISRREILDAWRANEATSVQEQFRTDSLPIGERITTFCFTHYIDNLTVSRRISYFVSNFPSLTSLQLSLVYQFVKFFHSPHSVSLSI